MKIKAHKDGINYLERMEIDARFNGNSLNASLKTCKRFWYIKNKLDIFILEINPFSGLLTNVIIQ